MNLAWLTLVVFVRIAAARPIDPRDEELEPKPTWVSGPDRAYNCTHYLDLHAAWRSPPQVSPGQKMQLVMRAGKTMSFTLAANATTTGTVTYELETAPIGAKLVGAKFTWKVTGPPGFTFHFDLVAVGANGARTKWPMQVTIADDKLVTAWSAGLGSVWPDCTVYAPTRPELVEDLDGDGKDDVIYKTFAGGDGTTETHVMLQRGKMKFVEVHSCFGCNPEPDVATDGTALLILQDSCCCIESGTIFRFDGDKAVEAAAWQEPGDCSANGATTITFDRDAKKRIKGITMTDDKGTVTTYRWKAKAFELASTNSKK